MDRKSTSTSSTATSTSSNQSGLLCRRKKNFQCAKKSVPNHRTSTFVSRIRKEEFQRRKINSSTSVSPSSSGIALLEFYVMDPELLLNLLTHFPYIFRIGDHVGSGPVILQEVCFERGWKEYSPPLEETAFSNQNQKQHTSVSLWNLWWSYSNLSTRTFQTLTTWQISNHSDRSFGFTSKDICTRYLRRLKNIYGEIYDLCPLSFNVPLEYSKLCVEHTCRRSKIFCNLMDSRPTTISKRLPLYKSVGITEEQPIWICKPVGKSQGRGIMVYDTVSNLAYNTRSVVQEYITIPYLIGGYKWDLRLYVAIVSKKPLVFYVYREGLVRFATEPFDLKNLYNLYSHLTNSSLNKMGPAYIKNKVGIGKGCKWSLRKLRKYFFDKGIKDWILWQKICSIITLTITGDGPNISTMSGINGSTFSLLGFDILVDRNLKPYLIEVNSNPSLSNDCEIDRKVKKPMLHELFDLLNLPDGRRYGGCNDTFRWDYCRPSHPVRSNSCSTISGSDTEESSSTSNKKNLRDNVNLASNDMKLACCPRQIMYKHGPIYAFKEIINLGLLSTSQLQDSGYWSSASRDSLESPELIKIPVMLDPVVTGKRKNYKKISVNNPKTPEYRPVGLSFGSPDWLHNPPAQVGNWVRTFPFNKETQEIGNRGRQFDVKEITQQVKEYLRTAENIQKAYGQDSNLDKLFMDAGALKTSVWHPPPVHHFNR